MPRKPERRYGWDDLHFITFSCYRRWKLLNTIARRELFMRSLEMMRKKYKLIILGFVVMPATCIYSSRNQRSRISPSG